MPEDQFGTYGEGMAKEPDMDDPAVAYAHRAMEAMHREFEHDPQVPRFVIVCETPPDGEILTGSLRGLEGRVGLASSGDDEIDTHRLLLMAALSVRRSMSGEVHTRAIHQWRDMEAQFKEHFVEFRRRD